MSASVCSCASEMCRRFGCQKDAQLLREYQAQRFGPAKASGSEVVEDIIRRVVREELDRRFGPSSE